MPRSVWLIAVFVLGLLSSAASALAESATPIPAGNIFAHQQALNICPKVCRNEGGKWDGNWRTNPGRGSECDCLGVDRRRGARGSGSGSRGGEMVDVRWTFRDSSPSMACFMTCSPRKWTNEYRPARNGSPAQCGCR